MFAIVFLAIMAAVLATLAYDIRLTVKGIKSGIAVERFTWLVGEKPSALALWLRDLLVLALTSAPAILAALAKSPAAWGLLIGPGVCAFKHVRGGREWTRIMAGGALPDPTIPKTAWQKFIEG